MSGILYFVSLLFLFLCVQRPASLCSGKVIKVKAKRCAKIVHISIIDILLYLWQNYTFFPTRQTFCKVFYIYVPLFPQPKPFYFSTSSSQICGFAVFLPKDT